MIAPLLNRETEVIQTQVVFKGDIQEKYRRFLKYGRNRGAELENTVTADIQENKFGVSPSRNGRSISAEVR